MKKNKIVQLAISIKSSEMTFENLNLFCESLSLVFYCNSIDQKAELCIPLFQLFNELILKNISNKKVKAVLNDLENVFISKKRVKEIKKGSLYELYNNIKSVY